MIIFSQKIAGQLMARGFILQKMDVNKKDETKNIFIFKDSNALEEAFKEITNKSN